MMECIEYFYMLLRILMYRGQEGTPGIQRLSQPTYLVNKQLVDKLTYKQ